MIKKILTSIFLLLFLWVPVFTGMTGVGTAYAQNQGDEYATSYDVIYDVSDDGTTLVTEKITLKNLTSQYYASQFKMTIGATQISDVRAFDEGGAMETKVSTEDSSTIIDVKFNTQVAGLGKSLSWTLSFKSKDFAEKTGKIWEIRAPKISFPKNLGHYNLTVSVPLSFGEPTLITPTPKSQSSANGRMFLTFSKNQLEQSGVSASFGFNQLFDFDLSYHLKNNNLVPILTNIALPPDTAYQDVIYQRLDPKPINVTLDSDGNYLAWYKLSRGQKMDIKLIGSAKLYTYSKVKNPSLSEDLRKKYTRADKYWEKDHPVILNKVNEVLGSNPPEDQTERVRKIYLYVVGALKYDSGRLTDNIERFGALTALNNPNTAVCMEFTDLFIAMARAAGIPARELNGYAYTANTKLRPTSLDKDILHAWPEYWDEKKGWVMVDPTWEHTTGGVDYFYKLDLNHFVFAIKGSSSSQPVPAGSYKYSNQNDHDDVKVTISDVDFLGKPQLDTKIESSGLLYAGFPGKIKVIIKNVGNALYPSALFSISAQKLLIHDITSQASGVIPPFGQSSFEFNVSTESLFDSYTDNIEVSVGGQKFNKEVTIKPFIIFQTLPPIGFGIIGLGLGIYVVVLGVFFYRKRFLKAKK